MDKTYRVNEIFYSLQGEGHFTGVPAVFVRFSGCNARCAFCDTRHESFTVMSAVEILDTINRFETRHVVLTGGEPSLQVSAELIARLHADGWFIQVETNGSVVLPEGIDWITCSPKALPVVYRRVNELKVVFDVCMSHSPLDAEGADVDTDPERFLSIEAEDYRLQPCDVGDPAKNAANIAATVDYIKRHPRWRLSLQTHKLISIP